MSIRKVTVLGTGVLGAQIAFQTAYSGFEVTSYDIDEDKIATARKTMEKLGHSYLNDLTDATPEKVAEGTARISYATDLELAVQQADLVIEAIPEILDLKKKVYAELGRLAPSETIFATNSSTLLPSDIAEATGRPERFLALHFANTIWLHNTAEVMGHAKTDPAIFDEIVSFAEDIGMVPIQVKKEQPGYVLNSLLVPFLRAASGLLVKGIASAEDIDKTWKIATGAPAGPFEIYDTVGLNTAYNVAMTGDETQKEFAAYIKENYIDKGKLGRATGEGFYKYQS
ncbi:3-hydroxyacyl-CoA dehydrogenase [Pacificibacter marinus]|uniref:Putative 3-hydroxybutyryl-CoA dehydrogenase n=1 Tax=Pacificibacter marinus TaxID=658057 RepID=A0A1Y5TMX1_9RHOB|nr:3-hydroxyacyl-CoA dehydrogenase [Pacificibacter marinus]SEK55076.1 3-hydroxybutyryl-CoA dehydrogenase [Pacificibacter marinus]SLN67785.1 putative 3-hydroxybutyryl-CoA dehydrogenase [Pacificibacter marinus]